MIVKKGEKMKYEVLYTKKVIAQFVHLSDAQMFFDAIREAHEDCHFELLTISKS